MSHFTVLLTNANSEEDIEAQLLPFCENTEHLPESYIEFVDETDQYKNTYENSGVTTFTSPNGQVFNEWESLEKKSGQYMPSVFFSNSGKKPKEWMEQEEGWSKKFFSYKAQYPTFEEYCEKKLEMTPTKEGRYGYFSNPNAKWDWYVLGGRWRGFFKLFPGYVTGELGSSGVFDNTAPFDCVDWVEKQYIDFETMMESSKLEASQRYENFQRLIKVYGVPKTWEEIKQESSELEEEIRKNFWAQPIILEMQKEKLLQLFSSPEDVLEYGDGSDKVAQEYIETHRLSVVIPFALIHQGKWHQRGEMGWFGTSKSEMTRAQWIRHAWSIIESLPPQSKLALMDCHI